MRLIDADALWVAFCRSEAIEDTYGSGVLGIISDILDDMLGDAPTVDAVTVVRCKDCTYYEESHEGAFCSSTGAGMPEDGYCSDGERRDEDNETD